MNKLTITKRIRFVFILLILFFFIIIYKDYSIQVKERDRYKELADREHYYILSVSTERGLILDRNFNAMAINVPVPSVYAIPGKIDNPQDAAHKISKILNINFNKLFKKLTSIFCLDKEKNKHLS